MSPPKLVKPGKKVVNLFCTMVKESLYKGVFFLAFFIFVMNFEIEAQCAMCKQAAESSLKSNPNSLARGLNSGILYLMAIPYLALMFIFRKQVAQLWKTATASFSKKK